MFKFIKTDIDGLYVIEQTVFADERGYFTETFNEKDFFIEGFNYKFVQDNESFSSYGVLRGLHFQYNNQQAKLVRVLSGKVFDVAVDLRRNSRTYGKWYGVILTEKNHKQFLIPRGFAHGFLVLSKNAKFAYKCDNFYCPDDEGGIIWNDPTIGIEWPTVKNLILSNKDTKYKSLRDANVKL